MRFNRRQYRSRRKYIRGGGVKQPLRKEREQMRQRTQRRQKAQIQEARTLPGNL